MLLQDKAQHSASCGPAQQRLSSLASDAVPCMTLLSWGSMPITILRIAGHILTRHDVCMPTERCPHSSGLCVADSFQPCVAFNKLCYCCLTCFDWQACLASKDCQPCDFELEHVIWATGRQDLRQCTLAVGWSQLL